MRFYYYGYNAKRIYVQNWNNLLKSNIVKRNYFVFYHYYVNKVISLVPNIRIELSQIMDNFKNEN